MDLKSIYEETQSSFINNLNNKELSESQKEFSKTLIELSSAISYQMIAEYHKQLTEELHQENQ